MAEGIVVTAKKNGPYYIKGRFRIVSAGGAVIESDGEEVWLCRCGESQNKPFCDGTHKRIGFSSDLDDGR